MIYIYIYIYIYLCIDRIMSEIYIFSDWYLGADIVLQKQFERIVHSEDSKVRDSFLSLVIIFIATSIL